MNKQIKDLALTSMFLGMTSLLVIIQIPLGVPGLSMDFSFVALLLSRRYIGLNGALLISVIFPWFSLLAPGGSGSIPGVLFILITAPSLLMLDYVFNKKKYTIIGIAATITLFTLVAMLANVLLIAPMYTGFSSFYDEFAKQAIQWAVISLVFNPFKLILVYVVTAILWPRLDEWNQSESTDQNKEEKE